MGKLGKSLLAIGGTVVGIVTLRFVRKRRSRNTEEELRELEHEDAETATEHAKAALEHTRQAARKTRKG